MGWEQGLLQRNIFPCINQKNFSRNIFPCINQKNFRNLHFSQSILEHYHGAGTLYNYGPAQQVLLQLQMFSYLQCNHRCQISSQYNFNCARVWAQFWSIVAWTLEEWVSGGQKQEQEEKEECCDWVAFWLIIGSVVVTWNSLTAFIFRIMGSTLWSSRGNLRFI